MSQATVERLVDTVSVAPARALSLHYPNYDMFAAVCTDCHVYIILTWPECT